MGFFGNLELKNKAQTMRKKGFSYKEIIQQLHLSKSTVSDWCHAVPLTKEQINNLYLSKKNGALKGSYIAARRKQEQRKLLTKEIHDEGFKDIGQMRKRDKFIAGIVLYASEGTKIDKGCCFSNSDPKLIKFMVNWFKEFCNVSENQFRGSIWLHEELNESSSKLFWSSVTNIPVSQFYKTYKVKNKKYSKKVRKNIHQYGVFSLYVNNTNLLRKIMGWIDGVLM